MGGRVIGGDEAEPNSWPWQLFLSFDGWDCGAVMIHPTWVFRNFINLSPNFLKGLLSLDES